MEGVESASKSTLKADVIFNVDFDRTNVASIHLKFPYQSVWGIATISIVGNRLQGELPILETDPQSNGEFPLLPAGNKFSAEIGENLVQGSWEAGMTSSRGKFFLEKQDLPKQREPEEVLTWREFRERFLQKSVVNPGLIFRGHHRSSQCLVTSFHRTGRRSLLRYRGEDIPSLQRSIESF